MNCSIVKDLIPLYIDKCCSEESGKMIEEHMKDCDDCKKLFEEMNAPSHFVTVAESPKAFSRLNDWKASVLQSVLLFFSFALITVGVALEAGIPSGLLNGFWASNLVIPATGFMLSLANWYFVRIYKNRNIFSRCCLIATLSITLCAYIWAGFHYDVNIVEIFANQDPAGIRHILQSTFLLNKVGLLLTVVFCFLSKVLSSQYARMLGKE